MKRRLSLWLPPIGYALLIFALSSIKYASLPEIKILSTDKLVHFGEYGAFGFILARLFLQLGWKSPFLWAVLIASFYGVTDEFHQYFVPGRSTEFFDWLADTLGAAAGSQFYRWWFIKISGKRKVGSPAGQNRETPAPPAGP